MKLPFILGMLGLINTAVASSEAIWEKSPDDTYAHYLTLAPEWVRECVLSNQETSRQMRRLCAPLDSPPDDEVTQGIKLTTRECEWQPLSNQYSGLTCSLLTLSNLNMHIFFKYSSRTSEGLHFNAEGNLEKVGGFAHRSILPACTGDLSGSMGCHEIRIDGSNVEFSQKGTDFLNFYLSTQPCASPSQIIFKNVKGTVKVVGLSADNTIFPKETEEGLTINYLPSLEQRLKAGRRQQLNPEGGSVSD